jgi:hypothetical protein
LFRIHSDAVDFVKTGVRPRIDPSLKAKKWPDFMREKKHLVVYESQTVLGSLFREIKAIIKGEKALETDKKDITKNWEIDCDLINQDWQKYGKEAAKMVKDFHSEMDGIINQFGIRNEFEIYSGNFSKLSKVIGRAMVLRKILRRKPKNTQNYIIFIEYIAFFFAFRKKEEEKPM